MEILWKSQNNLRLKKINVILKVNVLKSGDTFGELALLNDSKTTATIVAKENCEFSCLNKNAY
jgi:CRP-like cAMP-binding protein